MMTAPASASRHSRARRQNFQSCHYPTVIFIILLSYRLYNAPLVFFDDHHHPHDEDETVLRNRRQRQTTINATRLSPHNNNNNNNTLLLKPTSFLYASYNWDSSPIVVERYKLMVFSIPKVGCTLVKHLLRKMTLDNTTTTTLGDSYIHDPSKNGLVYLRHYPIQTANKMLTSPDWTRAIIVRNPKERVLSAYLDKARRNHGSYIKRHCRQGHHHHHHSNTTTNMSFEQFLKNTIPHCTDVHWMPQAFRMESEVWKYINFVAHLETAAHDMKVLLKQLGVYNLYGKTGWGPPYNNASIFEIPKSVKHATGANDLLQHYYTPQLEALVEDLYRVDYEHDILNLTLTKIQWTKNDTATAEG